MNAQDGWLRQADARVKLLCLLVYFLVAFHARTAPALALVFAVAVALAAVTRMGARRFLGVLRPLVAVLVVTVIMQVLYLQQGEVLVRLGPVAITWDALAASTRMLVCLLCVMVASAAFMRCTSAEDLTRAFTWLLRPLERMGLRTSGVTLALSIAFRFIPVLLNEFRQLKSAQEARLGSFDGSARSRLGAYARLFAPLVRSSFRRADMLAEASYARCFDCGVRATALHDRCLHARDAVLLAVMLVLATAVVALS